MLMDAVAEGQPLPAAARKLLTAMEQARRTVTPYLDPPRWSVSLASFAALAGSP